MAKRSRSWYAILGLLTYGPMSGYDIRQMIEQSIGFFWNESYGQIYPILKTLAEEGLATVTVEHQDNKPDRKVYAITEEGLAALRQQLTEAPRPMPERNEMLLHLFFGRHADHNDLRTMVENYATEQREMLHVYDQVEQRIRSHNHPDLPYWEITLNNGRHQARAMMAWAEETLKSLAELKNAD
ncbi:MAG: PadR family transcriptional regulator [Chloroflexi bacterium]|nr:PadR family transcriptional regulator [Chloroflexota bacterium]